MSTERLFLLFLSYSFVGYIAEIIYCSIKQRQFVNRGFLIGPVCPIYGFGALLILYLLEPYSKTYIPLFFATVIITSILEYVSSVVLEKVFGAKWWDYSNHKFNLNGRICLFNAVLFGLMGVLCVHFLHPIVMYWVTFPCDSVAKHIAFVLFCILLCDIMFTLRRLQVFSQSMTRLKEYIDTLKARYEGEEWFKGDNFASIAQSLKDKIQADKKAFSQKSIARLEVATQRHKELELWLKKFPSMKALHHEVVVEHIRMQMYKYKTQKSILKGIKD